MKINLKHLLLALFLACPTCYATLIVNGNAETGVLHPWVPVSDTYGSSPPAAGTSASINFSAENVASGMFSFYLEDFTPNNTIGLKYNELIQVSKNVDHILSFDLKVISGNLDPWVSLSLYTELERSQLIQTLGPSVSFGLNDVFATIVPVDNDFYTYIFYIPAMSVENNEYQLPDTLYYEMIFQSSFYYHQQGSIYVDNILFAPVPEPSLFAFLVIGFAIVALTRRIRSNNPIHRMATRVTPRAWVRSSPGTSRATGSHR